jgi:hypothetical protein
MQMRTLIVALVGGLLCVAGGAAYAHNLPWRPGDARLAGFGRCAKGSCTTRVIWADSKPHRHVNGKIVAFSRNGNRRS